MKINGSGLRIIKSSEAYWAVDVETAEKAVAELVKAPINENQFSALVSLAVTIGVRAFRTSQLLRCVNDSVRDQRNVYKAADLFLEWTGYGNRESSYLKRRRRRERHLFLKVTLVKPALRE